MNYREFVRQFREDQEIGRDLTDDELVIYRDNGSQVGTWRENRRTTTGSGQVLGPEDADRACEWFHQRRNIGRSR